MNVIERFGSLDISYFQLSGNNLERIGLFNETTKIYLVDPTNGPKSLLSPNDIENASISTASTISVPEIQYRNDTWVSNGWSIGQPEVFNKEIREWCFRNFNNKSLFADVFERRTVKLIQTIGNLQGTDYTIIFAYGGDIGFDFGTVPINNSNTIETSGGTVSGNTLTTTNTSGSEAGLVYFYNTNQVRHYLEFTVGGSPIEIVIEDSQSNVIYSETSENVPNEKGVKRIGFISTDSSITITLKLTSLSSTSEVDVLRMYEANGPYLLSNDDSTLLAENGEDITIE